MKKCKSEGLVDKSKLIEEFVELVGRKQLDWKTYSALIAQFHPGLLYPEKYNWEDYSLEVSQYCPEKLKLRSKEV